MSASRLLVIRHGESRWNLENRFQGQADIALTSAGVQQAELVASAVGERLAGATASLICSDLERAHATALVLGSRLGVPPVTDPALREIAAGTWQGLLQEEIQALDPETYRAWRAGRDVPLGGAERPSEAGERVGAAVRRHLRGAATQWLVVVGHGASLRAGVAALLDLPRLADRLGGLGNVCSAELGVDDPTGDAVLLRWGTSPAELGAPSSRAAPASSTV